jgi:hypothetical protein
MTLQCSTPICMYQFAVLTSEPTRMSPLGHLPYVIYGVRFIRMCVHLWVRMYIRIRTYIRIHIRMSRYVQANPRHARDYHLSVPDVMRFLTGSPGTPGGVLHLLARLFTKTRHRYMFAYSVSLGVALAGIDACPVKGGYYILVGSGKAFGFYNGQSAVLHLDTHQRSLDGVMRSDSTVCGIAHTAASLADALTADGTYGGGALYDVYQFERVSTRGGAGLPPPSGDVPPGDVPHPQLPTYAHYPRTHI